MFPDELLVLIFNAVESRADLLSLTCVCRRFSSVVAPFLYGSVLLRNRRDSITFMRGLLDHSERYSLVQKIAVHFEQLEKTFTLKSLSRMRNLRDISIDLPYTETDGLHGVFSLAAQPLLHLHSLPSLRNCTLRYWNKNGKRWDLYTKAIIFLVPTIQCLTIIGASADQMAMKHLPAPTRTTSLQELHFLECDIHPQFLTDLLAFPEALKRLTVGEDRSSVSMENSPYDPNDYINNPRDRDSRLNRLDTLESLTLIRAKALEWTTMRLQSLSNLTYLEIHPQLLFNLLIPDFLIFRIVQQQTDNLPQRLEELVLLGVQQYEFPMLARTLELLFSLKVGRGRMAALKRVTLVMSEPLYDSPELLASSKEAEVQVVVMKDRHMPLVHQTRDTLHDYLTRYRS